ncbi:MAG: hypothetical protein U9Q30_06930 [Campylobacterota bacterium]|nr:hypothetical protein [Campylobacterota bacterium]
MKFLYLLLFLTTLLFSNTKPDNCITCHKDTTPIDNFHPYEEFGCSSCHGGDKNALTKTKAHKNMILNPSRLEYASKYCGKCHQEIIDRVEKSIMNNMSGVLDVLKYQFHETKTIEHTKGIEYLKNKATKEQTLAEDHFSKLCAACHINQKEEIFNKEHYTPRGGGCVDCHRVGEKLIIKSEKLKIVHPKLSTKIPSSNCLKCHNRSNRIGLSYFGEFESEGYGTPYKNGKLTNKIDRGRYYYELPADIHHSSAKLDCIDCHTEKGVMGDGKSHKHMEDAVDISCKDCHKADFQDTTNFGLAGMLIALNEDIPYPEKIAISKRKNSPLYNVQKNDDNISFYRKIDGKKFDMGQMSDEPYHNLDIHKRLDCTACHSSWIASCYGCHEIYFKNGKQYDWIKHKKTKGKWVELRSYLRYESPALAIGYNNKIMPTAPGCQVITSVYDKNITDEGFHSFAYAAWDPHTTQKHSRGCVDCHFNPQTLGMGAGNLDIKDGNITFIPFYNSIESGMPINYPIDALVSKDGEQFQSFSRENARGFNKNEVNKIVKAYECIICHNSWSDKIYQDFNKSKKEFYNKNTQCSKELLK